MLLYQLKTVSMKAIQSMPLFFCFLISPVSGTSQVFTKQIHNSLAINALRGARSNYSSRHTKVYLLYPFAMKKLKSHALPVQLEGPEVIQTDLAMCRLQPHNGGQMLLSCERFLTWLWLETKCLKQKSDIGFFFVLSQTLSWE